MPLITLHTSTLFDHKQKEFLKDISVTVDTDTGLIRKVLSRDEASTPLPGVFPENEVDLRGKFVMPGFVDAHTHIFLHSYEQVPYPQLSSSKTNSRQ
jgi:imidazolonepropionase-like amidohydrolase